MAATECLCLTNRVMAEDNNDLLIDMGVSSTTPSIIKGIGVGGGGGGGGVGRRIFNAIGV